MSEENVKHLSKAAYLKQLQSIREAFDAFLDNSEALAEDSPLGRMDKLADKAYAIITQKGKFLNEDCARLGIFDTTEKKRLFSAIKRRHPELETGVSSRHGDKRKSYYAVKGQEVIEEMQKDPDQPIKEFVQKCNPTREQLVMHFSWGGNGGKKVGELVNLKKILLDQNTGRFTWIKD